jgi:hypothetical protein
MRDNLGEYMAKKESKNKNKKPVTVLLDKNLLKQLDLESGRLNLFRTAFIEKVLIERLQQNNITLSSEFIRS